MNFIIKRSFIILLVLLLTQRVFSQAPIISYSSPQTYAVGTAISPLTPTNTGGTVTVNGQTTTLAGSTPGYLDGTGTAAQFNHPEGIAVDASGNVYVSDAYNNRIRKITPFGVVTTFAGSGATGATNGTGTAASFNTPQGLAIDASGNIYVADFHNHMIRKITPAGVVSTLAGSGTAGFLDGTGTVAKFNSPNGVAVDALGNVYVSDNQNNAIRKITAAGVVTTLAGNGANGSTNGTGAAATFYSPFGMAVDPMGNVYVSDWYNHMIRKITPAGVVSTLAGSTTFGSADGVGTAASFYYPTYITIDAVGSLYVADEHNYKIRKVTAAGAVTTIAGTGVQGSANGAGSASTFYYPFAIATDSTGYVYVAEYGSSLIRKVAIAKYTITPAFTNGLAFSASTGTISGTPNTASATTGYPVTAYNGAGINTTTLSITVNAPSPIVPSITQNYVIRYTPRVSGLNTPAAVTTASADKTKVQTTIQYIDGIGRPLQNVQVRSSPLGNDVVEPFVYDPYGRESTKYLAYASQTGTTGSYRSTAVTEQNAFYTTPPSGVNPIPFANSQTLFEPSPLNRIIEQGAPGDNWQPQNTPGVSANAGHTIKTVYATNNSTSFAADSIGGTQAALYTTTVNSDQSQMLVANGFYQPGQLHITITKDENWKSGRSGTIEEYKDKEGHIVLKRAYNYAIVNNIPVVQILSTYYVFDILGNLAFVIPPMANGDTGASISQAALDNLCYQNRYDQRNRLVQKKIPGKGWEFMVYNTLDQVLFTQDANQRKLSPQVWTYLQYDALGRPVISGLWGSGGASGSAADTSISAPSHVLQQWLVSWVSQQSILWQVRDNSTTTGYSNLLPQGTYLNIYYYDSTNSIPNLPANFSTPTGASTMTRGLPVASKAVVLNTIANTTPDMLWTTHYYDNLGRDTITYKQHYLNGVLNNNNYDAVSTTYNFTNAPITVTRQHYNATSWPTPLVTVANKFSYDHMGRKLKTWEQITNGNMPTTPTWISQIDYNEIGQVVTKHLHSRDSINFYQNVGYTYNERGWLLTSNAPLFTMALYYNTSSNKAYNGNIMQQNWVTPTTPLLYYTYTYDKLNRLTAGTSSVGNHENNITYDQMGNITGLNRYQTGTPIDLLAYTYNGTNQLQSITDNSGNDAGLKHGTWNYTNDYDGNGNLIADPSKGIGIAYNLLNLPQNITGTKTITYTYDATGSKLRRVSPNTGHTDYINGIEYDDNGGTGGETLNFIQTEEGRAVVNGSDYNYQYNLSDNLANTRVTFDSATGSPRRIQQDDYYPFGMDIAVSPIPGQRNEYLYNKKELQEELGEYDYGARFYDPVISRWNAIDPLAEKGRKWSPYAYVFNNPIRFIDPDGMAPSDFIGEDGTKRHVEDGSTAQYREVGTGVNKHYEFTGFDQSQVNRGVPYRTEKNTVNLTTAVQEQQNLNASNAALAPIPGGATFCNYATQNILSTIASATNNSSGIAITGVANDMVSQMNCSPLFVKTDQGNAQALADQGGLGLIGLTENPHGHVTSFSVGANEDKGQVANIGRDNGFLNLSPQSDGTPSVFSTTSVANAQFFILNPNITPISIPTPTPPTPNPLNQIGN